MKKNEKNYINIASGVILLYFAGVAILRAHEQHADFLRFHPGEEASVNPFWYVLIFLLGAGLAVVIGWFFISKKNEISARSLLKQTKQKIVLAAEGCAGGFLAVMVGFLSISTLPNFKTRQPEENPVAAEAPVSEEQAKQDSYQFPIPDLPPVKPVDNLIGQAAGVITVNDTQSISGWQSSNQENTSVILAQDQSQLTLLQAVLNKTSSQDDPANAQKYGLNAALLVQPGGTVNMLGGAIQCAAPGAGAAAANGLNASLTISDTVMQTSGENSPLAFAGFQGQMHLRQTQMFSTGALSPSFEVRAGSSITADNVMTQTESIDSPIIQAAGTMAANSLNANAMGSAFAALRPGSDVTLTNCDISSNAGNKSQEASGMFVFAPIDTAKTDPARLTLSSTEVTFNPTSPWQNTAPLFFLQNCPANITLTRSVLTTPSGVLVSAASSKVAVTLDAQGLYGKMNGDAGSSLEVSITNGSTFAGSINTDNTCPNASLTLDAASKMTLTGDVYLTAFTNADPSNSNITASGFHIYVNGEAVV